MLLKGRGLTSAKCGEEVSFTIDGSQAGNGTPKVQLFSPTSELNVMLQHLGKKGDKYSSKCKFIEETRVKQYF